MLLYDVKHFRFFNTVSNNKLSVSISAFLNVFIYFICTVEISIIFLVLCLLTGVCRYKGMLLSLQIILKRKSRKYVHGVLVAMWIMLQSHRARILGLLLVWNVVHVSSYSSLTFSSSFLPSPKTCQWVDCPLYIRFCVWMCLWMCESVPRTNTWSSI